MSSYLYLLENLGSFCSNKVFPSSSKPTYHVWFPDREAATKPSSDIDSISIFKAVWPIVPTTIPLTVCGPGYPPSTTLALILKYCGGNSLLSSVNLNISPTSKLIGVPVGSPVVTLSLSTAIHFIEPSGKGVPPAPKASATSNSPNITPCLKLVKALIVGALLGLFLITVTWLSSQALDVMSLITILVLLKPSTVPFIDLSILIFLGSV